VARYVDGLPVATNLFEAAVWHKSVKVTCRCGHSVTFNPHSLWWLFEQRGWDMRLPQARRYFHCDKCLSAMRGKVRPTKIEPVAGMADVTLSMPPEREWKAALSRFR